MKKILSLFQVHYVSVLPKIEVSNYLLHRLCKGFSKLCNNATLPEVPHETLDVISSGDHVKYKMAKEERRE